MSKRKFPRYTEGSFDEVENVEANDEVSSVQSEPMAEVSKPVDDALVLKVDHTHAGVKYQAGTPVSKLSPSAAALDLMKSFGVI
jgi:hypothetical protein